MAYKVIDIYKDLPRRSGCDDCGKPGCFAFATSAHLEGLAIDKCPHLSAEQLRAMAQRVAQSRSVGDGPREGPEEQASQLLQEKVSSADFTEMARSSMTEHIVGPPEALRVELLGRAFLVRRDDVVAEDREDVDVWAKVVLMMYVTRASGRSVDGEWVAYRELPNTISKQVTYEKWVQRIPQAYSGRLDELKERARRIGGEQVTHDSADLALRFRALPRVPLLLLLWDKDVEDREFDARGSLLLDRNVLDYLDQEALTFLAEELMRSLL